MEKPKNNLFDDAIKDLENMRNAMKESLKQDKDVKDGVCTEEDQMNDPSYVLFDQITKSTIGILKGRMSLFLYSNPKLNEVDF